MKHPPHRFWWSLALGQVLTTPLPLRACSVVLSPHSHTRSRSGMFNKSPTDLSQTARARLTWPYKAYRTPSHTAVDSIHSVSLPCRWVCNPRNSGLGIHPSQVRSARWGLPHALHSKCVGGGENGTHGRPHGVHPKPNPHAGYDEVQQPIAYLKRLRGDLQNDIGLDPPLCQTLEVEQAQTCFGA